MSERVFILSTLPRGWQRAGVHVGKDGKPHHYTPQPTRDAQADVKAAYLAAYPRSKPHSGPVQMSVTATFVPPKSWPKWQRALALAGLWLHTSKPDEDNIGKLVKDALAGVAYTDDAVIFDGHVHKGYGDVPRLIVRMRLLEQPVKP